MSDEPPPPTPPPQDEKLPLPHLGKGGVTKSGGIHPPMPWNMTRSESEGFL